MATRDPCILLFAQDDDKVLSPVSVSPLSSVSSPQSAVTMTTMTPHLCLLLAASLPAALASTPVVLWHGMGDSAAGMIGIAVSTQ